jgi:predicted MFS family arabinose efflux permease
VATTLANIAALLGLLGPANGDRTAVLVMAVLAGLTQPQVGPLVRVHWSHRVEDDVLPTALAYEAAADETSFVAGPALVGLLTPAGPGVPLLATVALLCVTTLPFALRQGSPRRSVRRSRPGLLPIGPLSGMVLAMAAIGAIFGIVQTGVTAYAPNGAGLIYAEFGVGSALAGAACAWLPRRFALRLRYLVFAATLFIGMIALTLLPAPIGVAVAGVTVAPYMICLYSLTERLGRREQAATIMTILCAGGPLGTAAGRAVAGRLVDLHGSAGAFLAAPVVAGAAMVLAAVLVIGGVLREKSA